MQFYAFDILISDGEDIRRLPLSMRRTNLARLLARRANDIFVAPFEQGENGPDLFRHACLMGWRAWSPSVARAHIVVADPIAGSRSRTGNIRLTAASRISFRVAAGALCGLVN